MASTAAASCGLFGYERVPEESPGSPSLQWTDSDAGSAVAFAWTEVEQDAGADPALLTQTEIVPDAGTDPAGDGGDAGSAEDSGTQDAGVLSSGCDPATYVADVSCGVGYCRTTNQPSTCVGGVETPCVPGAPLGASDATCDSVDDNCNGSSDEDYPATVTSCGIGACASTGLLSCQAGSEVDSCVPGAPLATDTAASGVGIDDDCDGTADEDEPCDTTPRVYTPGTYAAIAVPLNCAQVTVRLWGGAGAGGALEGVLSQPGGRGGAGGYAESTLALVSGQQLDLLVGPGGSAGCNAAGALAGFGGGPGGAGTGADAEDGLQSGGGSGATPSSASRGGNGYRGGGGGGAGSPVIGLAGKGGGGGAASAFFVAGTPVMLAGGGGGGGGAASLILNVLGVAGGNGGAGCGGAGAIANQNGGGGGGGGACLGQLTQPGVNGVPYAAASLPTDQASGGQSSCQAGGGGYAIVTFGP